MYDPTKKQSPHKHKNSPQNSKTLKLSPIKQFKQKLYTKDYLCHYSNAIYMGGMDCFKKLGHGIMLLDNGTCAITCHSHDNMINHNVIFNDGSMTSFFINVTRVKTVCFRTGPFLVYFKLSANNCIEGMGYFIHYKHRKLYRLKFENDDITVKQRIVDEKILAQVFDKNDLSNFMQQYHVQAMKMQFDLPPYIRCVKSGQRFVIGLADSELMEPVLKGLTFKIVVKQMNLQFDLYLEERGYVKKNKIQKFGQRHFQNGNYYIGEFKNDKFDGRGILVYPKETKWTYGQFAAGELQKLLESSVVGQDSGSSAVLRKIHQYSKPYIQQNIKIIPNAKWLHFLTKIIDEKDPYEHESIDLTRNQNQVTESLNIVKEDYVNRKYDIRTEQAIKRLQRQQEKCKVRVNKKQSPKKSLTKRLSPQKNIKKGSPLKNLSSSLKQSPPKYLNKNENESIISMNPSIHSLLQSKSKSMKSDSEIKRAQIQNNIKFIRTLNKEIPNSNPIHIEEEKETIPKRQQPLQKRRSKTPTKSQQRYLYENSRRPYVSQYDFSKPNYNSSYDQAYIPRTSYIDHSNVPTPFVDPRSIASDYSLKKSLQKSQERARELSRQKYRQLQRQRYYLSPQRSIFKYIEDDYSLDSELRYRELTNRAYLGSRLYY